ncbi:hypothetical protein GPECTOR_10g916 [Gonium pectorale]|uniref:6-phosphogluconate dehydrogenase NADP-binding domain-containing protein n=1 Tax=Gonium pectorale TaxID=33097 RepID=A0A150GR62_GONPE|nr:hypothetical protein GPECTOR_10g916 [Gonium pectorale]|eukprot:KXZ52284.1 hypothetical protein GPECTOR_10g916 [Gonium pectorale]
MTTILRIPAGAASATLSSRADVPPAMSRSQISLIGGRNPAVLSVRPSTRASASGSARRVQPSLAPPCRSAQPLTCRASLTEAAPGKTVLGFVGIGIMGLAMTRNLLKMGYEVVVWNRNPDKCKPLADEGAKVASSPREVAAAATYTFAMLSDPEAALDVAMRPDGVVAGLAPGKGYVDVSTVDAGTSQAVAAAVRAAGGAFLEAPVSGSKGPAEQGKLIFLTAGDEALYHAVAAPLDAMGKARFFLGAEGAGANMKLVVNMVMGSMMTSFAEGLALADKARRQGLGDADFSAVMEAVAEQAAADGKEH